MDDFSSIVDGVQFAQQRRGYDVAAVDEYVDQVTAVVTRARARITELEGKGPRRSTGVGAVEDQASRILALAQRTADSVVEEATMEAERVSSEAQAAANATLRDADERASKILAEAETDRREMAVQAERAVADEVQAQRAEAEAVLAKLEEQRQLLGGDVAALEAWVSASREMVAAAISSLSQLLDDPTAFRNAGVPELNPVHAVPVAPEQAEPEDPQIATTEPVTDGGLPADDPNEGLAVSEPEIVDSDVASDPVPVEREQIQPAVGSDEQDPFTFDPGPPPEAVGILSDADLATRPADEDAEVVVQPWAVEGDHEPMWADEATSAVSVFGDDPPPAPSEPDDESLGEFQPEGEVDRSDDGDVLEQLRNAVTGPEVADDDDPLVAFFDEDDDDDGRNWFSRRR